MHCKNDLNTLSLLGSSKTALGYGTVTWFLSKFEQHSLKTEMVKMLWWRGGWKCPHLSAAIPDSSLHLIWAPLWRSCCCWGCLCSSVSHSFLYGCGTPNLHLNPLCQRACCSGDPSVSSSLYPFVRDKFQFQNIDKTKPQQQLHWHPPKYLRNWPGKVAQFMFYWAKLLPPWPSQADSDTRQGVGSLGWY